MESKLFCRILGYPSLPIDAKPADTIGDLKKLIFKDLPKKPAAAVELILVRVYSDQDPASGVKSSFKFDKLVQAVQELGSEAEEIETENDPFPFPGFEWNDGGKVSAKVMNPGVPCEFYGLNRPSAILTVDVVVILPATGSQQDPAASSQSTADFGRMVKEQTERIVKEQTERIVREQTERILFEMPTKIKEGFSNKICTEANMSKASSEFKSNLFRDFGISIFEISDFEESSGQGDLKVPAFQWQDGKEDSTNNKNAYLAHIENILSISPPFHVFDGDIAEANLKTTLGEPNECEYKLNGNADVLISSSASEELSVDTCHIFFELRKPTNRDKKLKQVQLELLAADSKSSYSVIAVITDLVESWKIFWIREDKNIGCTGYITRDKAVAFLRQHLQILRRMIFRDAAFPTKSDASPDSDGDSDDSDVNNDGTSKKRRHGKGDKNNRMTKISRITFSASKLNKVGASIPDDYDEREMVDDFQDDFSSRQKSIRAIHKFIDKHRDHLMSRGIITC